MGKNKTSKITIPKQVNSVNPEEMEALIVTSNNGLNLILDNSLSKYANDRSFIQQAEIVNRKFENHKTNTSQSDSNV